MTQLGQVPPFEVHWQSPLKHIRNLKKLHKLTREKNILNMHIWNKNAPSVSSYIYHLLYLSSYLMFESASKHLDMCLSPLTALVSVTVWLQIYHCQTACSHKQWHVLNDMCCHSASRQWLRSKVTGRSIGYVTQDELCKTLFDIHCLQLNLSPLCEPSPSLQACLTSKAHSMHYFCLIRYYPGGMQSQGFQKFSLY